jgi:hypothetical protein
MPQTPLIAAIHYQRFFPLNELLAAVVGELRAKGIAPGGVLEMAEPAADACRAPLNVVDILSGETARITQDCGEGSRGCRLDERGLAAITPRIMAAIEARAPLIIISKFGRAEAEGKGLLPCIIEAVTAGLPVLTSAREPYLEAWRDFHGGLGAELSPELNAITSWCAAAYRRA